MEGHKSNDKMENKTANEYEMDSNKDCNLHGTNLSNLLSLLG